MSFKLLINKFEETINIMLKNKKNRNIYWNKLTMLNHIFIKNKKYYENKYKIYNAWDKYIKSNLKQRT